MQRKVFVALITIFLSLSFLSSSPAETIILKSGKTVEGRIIEKTDKYVKIDFCGVPLTYFLDEVEYISSNKEPSRNKDLSPDKAATADKKEGEKSFLWQVQSNTGTVYLLGSIHVAKKELYPLSRAIERAFDISEVLVVELDDRKVGNAQFLGLEKKGTLPDDDTFQRHLSEKTFQVTKEKLANLGVNIVNVLKYKPWYLSILLMRWSLYNTGYTPEMGIDLYFIRKAGSAKEILELEGFDFQANLFSSWTEQEQDLLVYYTIVDWDNVSKQLDKLFAAWKLGEAEYIYQLTFKALADHPEFSSIYDRLLIQRNKNMAARIEKYLENKRIYFIVVGAGHLVGPEGIVELLRQKGYSVKQL